MILRLLKLMFSSYTKHLACFIIITTTYDDGYLTMMMTKVTWLVLSCISKSHNSKLIRLKCTRWHIKSFWSVKIHDRLVRPNLMWQLSGTWLEHPILNDTNYLLLRFLPHKLNRNYQKQEYKSLKTRELIMYNINLESHIPNCHHSTN